MEVSYRSRLPNPRAEWTAKSRGGRFSRRGRLCSSAIKAHGEKDVRRGYHVICRFVRRSDVKYIATIGVLILVLSNIAGAQQSSDVHQQTTLPTGARFEVVQSELAAKWTFRLDRFTGHVAQLVRTKDDDNTWEEMRIIGLPVVSAPSRARFQLFASGLAARYTFLIDTDTGKTWVVVTGKRKLPDGSEYEVHSWQAFAE